MAEHQAYRRNSIDLNCKRHKSIFNEYEIIPEFCFSCYKVQVEPRTLIELIKLFIVFDQIELEGNNNRKCLIELRPEISGFYKGLVYCSGLKQANQISTYLSKVLTERIGYGLLCEVKRGCSEYPISFPKYKEINNFGPQVMNFNKDWKALEDEHDEKKSITADETRRPTIRGLNLSDFLIFRKWIDYAKGLGDPTVNLFKERTVLYHDIYDKAKARIDNIKN